MLKTFWEYSPETEALRLIHAAHQIVVGFYRVNNFIVLPNLSQNTGVNTVSFPDLPYRNIKGFWEKAKAVDVIDLPVKVDPGFLKGVCELMKQSRFADINYDHLKNKWTKAESEILTKIYDIIPSKKDSVKKITIYPTAFGTSSSFNWIKSGEVVMYIRVDQGISAITEAVITSLTRRDIYSKLDGMWQESEIITDWLITQSALSEIIRKYDPVPFLPTVKGVRVKQQANLMKASDEYYKKLGFPTGTKIFGLNGLTPEVHKKPIENLTATEKTILRLLIQKAGGVVSFDEFGNELFKDESDYSLYAITKTIERLRNKLETNGVSGSYIQTLRGKGYLLKN